MYIIFFDNEDIFSVISLSRSHYLIHHTPTACFILANFPFDSTSSFSLVTGLYLSVVYALPNSSPIEFDFKHLSLQDGTRSRR